MYKKLLLKDFSLFEILERLFQSRVPLYQVNFKVICKIFFHFFIGKKFKINDIEQMLRKYGYKGEFLFFKSARNSLYFLLQNLKNNYPLKNEVILPSFTCSVVIEAIIRSGLRPIIVDIESSCYPNIGIKNIIKFSSYNTLAVIIPSMGGYEINGIDKIKKFCKKNEIFLIDDAAQAFGLKLKNELVGNIGDFGILSFGNGKQILGCGGGVLILNSNKISFFSNELRPLKRMKLNLAEIISYFITYYLSKNNCLFLIKTFISRLAYKHEVNTLSYESISQTQINVVKVILDSYSDVHEIRLNISKNLNKNLENRNLKVISHHNSVYCKLYYMFNTPFEMEKFRKFLWVKGIETEIGQYPLDKRLEYLKYATSSCPNSTYFYERVIQIPNCIYSKGPLKKLEKNIYKYFEKYVY